MNEELNKESESTQQDEVKNESNSVSKNKPMAIIGYILPILFFIPLLSDAKNNAYAKFHANQQLNLLLVAIAVNIIGGAIPIIGWFIIWPLGTLFLIVLVIMGVVNASKEEMKKLPLIGGFELIK